MTVAATFGNTQDLYAINQSYIDSFPQPGRFHSGVGRHFNVSIFGTSYNSQLFLW